MRRFGRQTGVDGVASRGACDGRCAPLPRVPRFPRDKPHRGPTDRDPRRQSDHVPTPGLGHPCAHDADRPARCRPTSPTSPRCPRSTATAGASPGAPGAASRVRKRPDAARTSARVRPLRPAGASPTSAWRTCAGRRSASASTRDNTHPFTDGRVAFAHNGSIRPPAALDGLLTDRSQRRRKGTTDSERYFLAVAQLLRDGAAPERRPADDGRRDRRDRRVHQPQLPPADPGQALRTLPLRPGRPVEDDDPDYYRLRYRTSPDAVVVASSGWGRDWQELANGDLLVVRRRTLETTVVSGAGVSPAVLSPGLVRAGVLREAEQRGHQRERGVAGTGRAPPRGAATGTCGTCSPRTPARGEELTVPRRRPVPRLLQEPADRARRSGCSWRWPSGPGCASAPRRCSPASTSTPPRTAPSCTSRCATRRRSGLEVDGQDVAARRARGARPDGRLRRPGARRRVDRAHRRAHPRRRQHRHRRLRPRARRWPTRRCATTPTASLTFRFVSNIDPTDLAEATRDLDPATTLFIVASKTFTTQETLTNATRGPALAARRAGRRRRAPSPSTSSPSPPTPRRSPRSASTPANMFGFWDWVGGRYSFNSAIGLSLMVAIGPEHFREMLDGFHTIDEHFRTAPYEENLPALLGLISLWYTDFFGAQTPGGAALLPVPRPLPGLPAAAVHGVQRQVGHPRRRRRSTSHTGEIVWGEPGTNGQHAFYQLLHQGTRARAGRLPRLRRSPTTTSTACTTCSSSNLLAQPRALAFGKTAEEVAAEGTAADVVPHKVMPGNHPSQRDRSRRS